MAMTSEQLYQRLLRKKQSSPSKAPVAPIKSDRRFNDEKDKEKDVIAPLPEAPGDDVNKEEELPKEYSEETKKLGREMAAWIRECRRR